MKVFPSYVSCLINYIIQTYHFEATTVCVLWNDNFPFTLKQLNTRSYTVITSIYKSAYDDPDSEHLSTNMSVLTKFEDKLSKSIEKQHCESFIAFEEEIVSFATSFMKSVIHSKWRSLANKFLFVYTHGLFNLTSAFSHAFFKEQPNILFIEIVNETVFNLKTTKFIGSRKDNPEELVLLDRYYGETESFQFNHYLYPDKMRNLEGRELIVAAFSYEPYSILKNSTETNVMDVGNGNEDLTRRLLYDGTDAQLYFNLCWLYNCTVQIDSSETIEWGFIYPNLTGDGILGLIFDKKADIGMMALYMWHDIYLRLDMSIQTSRSGATCLVPKPNRLTSWFLPFIPFHWLLWLTLAGFLILEMVALTVICKIGEEKSWTYSIKFGYSSTLKLFISQGTNYMFNSISVRTILLSCYIIDIIITSLYSGGLATILTVPSFEEAADTVDRLAKHKLIWAGTSYDWILVFNDINEENLLQILANFRVYSYEHLREKSLKEHIGFVLERMQYGHFAIPGFIQQDAADRLKVMKDDIYYQYCVAYTAKSWPFLEKYNNFILMVQSSGLDKFWEWMVVAKHLDENLQKQIAASVYNDLYDAGAVELGIANFAGIILIWIIGIVLSIFVFLAEVIYSQWIIK